MAVTALAAALMVATFAGSIPCRLRPGQPLAGIDWGAATRRTPDVGGRRFPEGKSRRHRFHATNLSDPNLARQPGKATLVRTCSPAPTHQGQFLQSRGLSPGFEGVNAEGANFTGAELQRANFNRAVLKGVNFEKAEPGRVIFKGADVTGVNFALTNLSRADLTGATFTGPISLRSRLPCSRRGSADWIRPCATGLDAACRLLRWLAAI